LKLKGISYYHLNQYEKGIKCFERIWNIQKEYNRKVEDIELYYYKGATLKALGKKEEALMVFNEVVKKEKMRTKRMKIKGREVLQNPFAKKCLEEVNQIRK
jgi:tetratricopeptide (TPR) repeat protein